MCSACIGNPKTQTLHACFQGLVDCKNGSFEILDGETLFMMSMIVYDEKLCYDEYDCLWWETLFQWPSKVHKYQYIQTHTIFYFSNFSIFFIIFMKKNKAKLKTTKTKTWKKTHKA